MGIDTIANDHRFGCGRVVIRYERLMKVTSVPSSDARLESPRPQKLKASKSQSLKASKPRSLEASKAQRLKGSKA